MSFALVAYTRILGRNLDDFHGNMYTLDAAQMIKQIDRTNVLHLFAGTKDRFDDIPIGAFVVYISSEKTGILEIHAQDAASSIHSIVIL